MAPSAVTPVIISHQINLASLSNDALVIAGSPAAAFVAQNHGTGSRDARGRGVRHRRVEISRRKTHFLHAIAVKMRISLSLNLVTPPE